MWPNLLSWCKRLVPRPLFVHLKFVFTLPGFGLDTDSALALLSLPDASLAFAFSRVACSPGL